MTISGCNIMSLSLCFNLHKINYMYIVHLGCVSLRKSKLGFLNPKESENGFCVSLLNKYLIQDLSDHGASNEPRNPLPEWILQFL